jgi:hypothetical protein
MFPIAKAFAITTALIVALPALAGEEKAAASAVVVAAPHNATQVPSAMPTPWQTLITAITAVLVTGLINWFTARMNNSHQLRMQREQNAVRMAFDELARMRSFATRESRLTRKRYLIPPIEVLLAYELEILRLFDVDGTEKKVEEVFSIANQRYEKTWEIARKRGIREESV